MKMWSLEKAAVCLCFCLLRVFYWLIIIYNRQHFLQASSSLVKAASSAACAVINSDYSIESDTTPLSAAPWACAVLVSTMCSNAHFLCRCEICPWGVPCCYCIRWSDRWGGGVFAGRFCSPAFGAPSALMWTEYRKWVCFEICWHSSPRMLIDSLLLCALKGRPCSAISSIFLWLFEKLLETRSSFPLAQWARYPLGLCMSSGLMNDILCAVWARHCEEVQLGSVYVCNAVTWTKWIQILQHVWKTMEMNIVT